VVDTTTSLASGVQSFRSLLQAIFDETQRNYQGCPHSGFDHDPIDYAYISTLVDQYIRRELLSNNEQPHREGFLRALALLLATHCDPMEWAGLDPIERTAPAFDAKNVRHLAENT
jgi:hypothetical protein